MSSVDRNIKDMPIPSFAYPDRFDGRVFIKSVDSETGSVSKKTIGHMTDSTPGMERMVPNRYFKETYQDLFKEAYPMAKVPLHEMSVGMYAATLGAASEIGLYSDLREVYGPEYANNILDYAMFSILHRSDVSQIYEQTMAREVLFCDKVRSDSWYSNFFSKKISEDNHHQFRIRWIRRLVQNGLKKVWLSIDGSNNDCEARSSFLAKYGFPKSHNKNKTIVGYMYAVDAGTGCPVTYFTYEGSVPDSQAFQKMAVFLRSFDIEIEGVILDRGFAVESVFKEICGNGWKYVIMLPTDTNAHTQMLKEHAEDIRWKSEYLLEGRTLFGISDEKKLFAGHSRVSTVCMFFDGAGGSAQSIQLIRKIQAAKKKAEQAITSGKRAAIESRLRKYLKIEGEGPSRKVVFQHDVCDESMASKGFYSIAVSAGITPGRADELYGMRDTSETQFCILKSQEGGNATRTHKSEGIYSKFAVMFVASIIRFEMEKACRKHDLDTNPLIQGLEHVCLLYSAEGKYEAVRNLSVEQKKFYSEFNIDQDDLERIAREFNKRNNKDSRNPDRRLPDNKKPLIQNNSHKRGRPSAGPDKESQDSSETVQVKEKSKGGRPKGKKDSKPRKPRSDKGKPRGKQSGN